MAVVSTEVEIASPSPPAQLFKVLADFDNLAPKAAPDVFKSITTIEGDGGVGTIKSIAYGDGVPYTSSTNKIDAVDPSNFSISYTMVEGDILMDSIHSINHHIKILASADGGSTYKHTTVFNCKGETKPTDEILHFTNENYKKVFKAIEAHVSANP